MTEPHPKFHVETHCPPPTRKRVVIHPKYRPTCLLSVLHMLFTNIIFAHKSKTLDKAQPQRQAGRNGSDAWTTFSLLFESLYLAIIPPAPRSYLRLLWKVTWQQQDRNHTDSVDRKEWMDPTRGIWPTTKLRKVVTPRRQYITQAVHRCVAVESEDTCVRQKRHIRWWRFSTDLRFQMKSCNQSTTQANDA